ncbi:hypothetical protein DQQ11_15040 [Lactiplantibacillus plantarum]|nr:hypothetical protein DQQ11_15040 [Lactiplantibacillus plantarum]
MDCVVTPLKTLMGFSVHLNVQLKFYNLPYLIVIEIINTLGVIGILRCLLKLRIKILSYYSR